MTFAAKTKTLCFRTATLLALTLPLTQLTGCAGSGAFPHASGTNVDLSRKNYKIIQANAIGRSHGFSLLGIIPIVPPEYTEAMSDLYQNSGTSEGEAQALVNVIQERSNLYLILFSIPRLTVRADIIEFTDQ